MKINIACQTAIFGLLVAMFSTACNSDSASGGVSASASSTTRILGQVLAPSTGVTTAPPQPLRNALVTVDTFVLGQVARRVTGMGLLGTTVTDNNGEFVVNVPGLSNESFVQVFVEGQLEDGGEPIQLLDIAPVNDTSIMRNIDANSTVASEAFAAARDEALLQDASFDEARAAREEADMIAQEVIQQRPFDVRDPLAFDDNREQALGGLRDSIDMIIPPRMPQPTMPTNESEMMDTESGQDVGQAMMDEQTAEQMPGGGGMSGMPMHGGGSQPPR